MKPTRLALLLSFVAAFAAPAARAQRNPDEAAIRVALDAQVAAWNRGDIPAFMRAYENSPETTFIGQQVRKGYVPILNRYKTMYATPQLMGKLSFTNIEVRVLNSSCGPPQIAVVTGNFHLERTQRGEGQKDDGIFSLVWWKSSQGWKIVLDHTS
jgi:ketosteroid isomerase-like protein